MDINVTFQNGRWITDPSPAIVAIGTRVRWIFRASNQTTRALLWRISFNGRFPFGDERATLEVTTEFVDSRQREYRDFEMLRRLDLAEDSELSHRGATEAQLADRPGEYKYDLVVEDANNRERIGYDDPLLIVVSGIFHSFDPLLPFGYLVI